MFSQAIFHYSAHTNCSECLKVCITTPEMDAATWQFGHRNQLILDGTFGVCSSRLLVFIAMVTDEENKGLPVAFLIFSAPSRNCATHAGYNTKILAELLGFWNNHLEHHSRSNEPFKPFVRMTDTDMKE